MTQPDQVYSLAILSVFPFAMALACATDLLTMTISNRLTVGLALAFFVLAAWSGMALADVAWHLSAGAAVLVVAFGLFARGWIGGGDAKLMAATALWLGWGPLPYYGFIAAIAGGLLALALLRLRGALLPEWMSRQGWIARLHRADQGAPYGIALAVGGLFAYSHSVWLTAGPV
jgi:prepilin peptidase CpaA